MAGPDAGSDCPSSSLPSPCLSFVPCVMREDTAYSLGWQQGRVGKGLVSGGHREATRC